MRLKHLIDPYTTKGGNPMKEINSKKIKEIIKALGKDFLIFLLFTKFVAFLDIYLFL